MNKTKLILLDVAAYLGSGFFLCAFIFSIFVSDPKYINAISFMPVLAFALGVISLVFTFVYSHKAYHLFLGLFLILGSIFVFLCLTNIVSWTIYQWWPLLGVLVGFSSFFAGKYKYKKIKIGYAIPSLSIFLFGLWLSLFSFKIVKISFTTVALIGAPLFMILVCIFLVALLLVQQKYKNLVVKDDSSDSFDDDELTVEKSGE